jgi:hypothetical protein
MVSRLGRSAELRAFEIYLRHGMVVDRAELDEERKFNPYHDPDDGRFTFAPGRGTLAPRSGLGRNVVSQVGQRSNSKSPAPQTHQESAEHPATSHKLGSLAAKYESAGPGDREQFRQVSMIREESRTANISIRPRKVSSRNSSPAPRHGPGHQTSMVSHRVLRNSVRSGAKLLNVMGRRLGMPKINLQGALTTTLQYEASLDRLV